MAENKNALENLLYCAINHRLVDQVVGEWNLCNYCPEADLLRRSLQGEGKFIRFSLHDVATSTFQ
jgi:hypothetical protein